MVYIIIEQPAYPVYMRLLPLIEALFACVCTLQTKYGLTLITLYYPLSPGTWKIGQPLFY